MKTINKNEVDFPIKTVAARLGFKINRGYRILCLNCHERRITVKLNLHNNTWECPECFNSGETLDLVMEVLNTDWKSAREWLQANCNSEPKREHFSRLHRRKRRFVDPLTPMGDHRADPDIYQFLIDNNPLLRSGRSYLLGRGYSEEIVNKLRIAQIDNPDYAIVSMFSQWNLDDLRKAGIIEKDINTGWENLIWPNSTLLFPFYNDHGILNYIQGRALKSHKRERYINPIGIPTTIYNFSHLQKLKPGDDVYFFEGVTDCISGIQEGLNAFGILGAYNFKDSWVKHFLPFHIHVVPDRDRPGTFFAESVTRAFSEVGNMVTVERFPFGKDYNEYIMLRDTVGMRGEWD